MDNWQRALWELRGKIAGGFHFLLVLGESESGTAAGAKNSDSRRKVSSHLKA